MPIDEIPGVSPVGAEAFLQAHWLSRLPGDEVQAAYRALREAGGAPQ